MSSFLKKKKRNEWCFYIPGNEWVSRDLDRRNGIGGGTFMLSMLIGSFDILLIGHSKLHEAPGLIPVVDEPALETFRAGISLP